ncbi:MAG: hypothetical protein Q4G27_01915 [Flavobacteriaceae bacterium]|nr:hypothetical protein [Flavobacteriaceae bacterium]
MKKVLLLAVVAGMVSVTSCKKETTEKVETTAQEAGNVIVETGQDAANILDEGFESAKAAITDAPQISNPELQEWANKLHDEAAKAKAASVAGNQSELNEAVASITSLAESLKNFTADADFAKAEAYYKEIQAELEQF